MWMAVIGMILGNIVGGFITGNWPLTLGVFLGQVNTLFVLAITGQIRNG